jgi:hypothetical protein
MNERGMTLACFKATETPTLSLEPKPKSQEVDAVQLVVRNKLDMYNNRISKNKFEVD